MPTDYGLPGGGNVNIGPWQQLQAMFPYVTFGPQMAQQLANLQFGAGLDAQQANNALSMQLAQGAASNRFADNIASKLAVNGMGGIPGFGSAFQGGWGVSPVQPPNILDMYRNINSGLGSIFGGQNPAQASNTGQLGAGGMQPFGGTIGTPWSQPPQPVIGDPWSSPPGIPNTRPTDTPSTFGAKQGALPQGWSPWEGGGGGFVNPQGQFSATVSPMASTKMAGQRPGMKMPAQQPRFGNATNDPRMGVQPQNPYQQLHQLAFGQGGFGPSYFSAGALGSGSPGFGAPRTNLTQYYGASPDQRQAQDYFMQSQAGYSPEQLAYERQFFTPGARAFGR